ncbi:hypothetical protein UlMin_011523 [Ulmus minor]
MVEMVSPITILILCSISILANNAIAQPNYIYHFCQTNKGNYTTNSTYKSNLDNLLSTLPSNEANTYGFYNSSYGNGTDEAYAIGLCRGDVKLDLCQSCVNVSYHRLTELCPNNKQAVVWYDECMLRYSNSSMLGDSESSPRAYLVNPENVSSNANSVSTFFQDLRTLLDNLKNRASGGDSLRKFSTGNLSTSDFKTIYALAQCTPDLSRQECNNCLDDIFGVIPECCSGKIGGRVISPSCNFRYEDYLFYELTEEEAPPTSPPPSPLQQPVAPPPPLTNPAAAEGGKGNSKIIIFIVVPSVAAVILFTSICVYMRMRRRQNKVQETDVTEEIGSAESLQYDFSSIRVATDDFSEANKLGQGGFGPVYRGKLTDGQDVAVKRLSKNSGQGDLEFKNEVQLVAKLQHRNLVRLLGFCLERNERLLVYEFVPNASLDHFIFDPNKRASLDWDRRYKIIGGIARGILYLHEDSRLRIIHRDLKASNILLDKEMHPKISDFGMARLFQVDQTQGNTSRIVGTYGYMAPEYAMHGQFSVKSDVFSFGVLLLEIVSGQKNNGFRHGKHVEDLLSYAWRNWREGTSSNLVDPLMRAGSGSEITRCIHIGLLCVQENVADRPSMNTVVLMLNSYSLSLPVPSQPAFFMHSRPDLSLVESDVSFGVIESDHSKSNSVQASINEASITDLYPR